MSGEARTFTMDVVIKYGAHAGQGVKLSVEVHAPAVALSRLEWMLEDTTTSALLESGLGHTDNGISTHTTVDPWPLEPNGFKG